MSGFWGDLHHQINNFLLKKEKKKGWTKGWTNYFTKKYT